MTLTLEIASSIIFPQPIAHGGAVTIDITPPSPTGLTPTPAPAPPLATGPENPLYRLPQSLSSGGLKVHLNAFVKPRVKESPEGQASSELTRDSRTSILDKDHILYEITKTPVGADYNLTCFRHGKHSGGYGYGTMEFKAGWFSGGTWTVNFMTKAPGKLVEHRICMSVDEGGKDDGVWKMWEPVEKIVARENAVSPDSYGENGRAVEIYDDQVTGAAGMPEVEWRDFLTACWITKVWREATRAPMMANSARKGETGALGRW